MFLSHTKLMKSEIKYNAAPETQTVIHQWQGWLKDERRYSPHTLDGYCRDLADFFGFFDKALSLADLAKLEVRDFRGYISACAAHGLDKSSLARHISTIKNFFKTQPSAPFLRRGGIKCCLKLWKLIRHLMFWKKVQNLQKIHGKGLEMPPFLQYFTDAVCEFLKPCQSIAVI